jgi:hypothetical protein
MSTLVRSGRVPAKNNANGPTWAPVASSATRREPVASMTATSSSAYTSDGGSGSGGNGSEAPVPRRSKRSSRENEAGRRRNNAIWGSSQTMSTWLKAPMVNTRSGGPCPRTW